MRSRYSRTDAIKILNLTFILAVTFEVVPLHSHTQVPPFFAVLQSSYSSVFSEIQKVIFCKRVQYCSRFLFNFFNSSIQEWLLPTKPGFMVITSKLNNNRLNGRVQTRQNPRNTVKWKAIWRAYSLFFWHERRSAQKICPSWSEAQFPVLLQCSELTR